LKTKELATLRAENRALRSKFASAHPCVPVSGDMVNWLKSRMIFAVRHKGGELVPAFQFDGDGRPRPIIREVLNLLPSQLSPWQVAFWFASANSWLGGLAPCEALDSPKRVIEAARMEAADIAG